MPEQIKFNRKNIKPMKRIKKLLKQLLTWLSPVSKLRIRRKIDERQEKIDNCNFERAKINNTNNSDCSLAEALDLQYNQYTFLIYEHEVVQEALNDLLNNQ